MSKIFLRKASSLLSDSSRRGIALKTVATVGSVVAGGSVVVGSVWKLGSSLATRDELKEMRSEILKHGDELRSKIKDLRSETMEVNSELRKDIKNDFSELRKLIVTSLERR